MIPDGMVISKKEWMILLTAIGERTYLGFRNESSSQNLTKEDMHETLYQMVRDGLVKVTKLGIETTEFLQIALKTVADSEKVLSVHFADPIQPDICFYISERIVSITESKKKEGELEVYLLDESQIWNIIHAMYKFPVDRLSGQALAENLLEGEEAYIQNNKEMEEQASLILELISKKSKQAELCLMLENRGIYPRMVFMIGNEVKEAEYFSVKKMKNRIRGMIRGKRA